MKKVLLALLLLAAPLHATVLDTSNGRTVVTGNGSTLAYTFAFPTYQASYVTASVTAAVTNALVVISYSTSLNLDQNNTPGGTVTFLTPPPNGSTITIQRTQLLINTLNLSPLGYSSTALNKQFDTVIEQIQQVQRNLSDLAGPPQSPNFVSLFSGNNTWTGTNTWTAAGQFNNLSVQIGGSGDPTVFTAFNGQTGFLSVGGGIWPNDFVGGGIHTDQIADATGSWGLYLQDGGRTELFSDNMLFKDTSASGINFQLSGNATFNTLIVGNGGASFLNGTTLTGTAAKGSLFFTPQAQPTTHADGAVYYGTDHLLHFWNGTAWTLLGGSITTGATLTGAGTVASPLNVNQANSFSWTANNFWGAAQTFSGSTGSGAPSVIITGSRATSGTAGSGLLVQGGSEVDGSPSLGVAITAQGGLESVLSGEGSSAVPGDSIVTTGGAHHGAGLVATGGAGGVSYQSGNGVTSTGGASNVGAGGAFEPGAGGVFTGGDGTADGSGGGPGLLAVGGPGGGVGLIGIGSVAQAGINGTGGPSGGSGGLFQAQTGADAVQAFVNAGNGNGVTAGAHGTGVGGAFTGGATNGNGINASAGGGNATGISAIGSGTGPGVTAVNAGSGGTGPAVLATTQGASSDVAVKLNQQGTAHGGVGYNVLSAAPSAPANGETWVQGSTTAMNFAVRLNGTTVKLCGTGGGTSSSCQSKRGVAGCATTAAIGATCTTTVTWTNAFADNLYFVSCIGVGVTGGAPILQGTTARTTSSATIQTIALTAVIAQFTTVECFGFHD